MMPSVKTALRLKGFKPIPPYEKLRSPRRAGDVEVTPKGLIRFGDVK